MRSKLLLGTALSVLVCTSASSQVSQPPPVNIFVPAQCNGVADDAATIQAAANANSSGAKQLVLPKGTCIIGTSISLPNNVSLIGSGRGVTVLKMKPTTNLNPMIGNTTLGGSFIEVRSLTLDGNKAQNGAGTSQGIHFVQLSNAIIDNVEVENVNGPGISLDGNGVNTTRGDVVNEVYTHNNDLYGFIVTFAQRQTSITSLHSFQDGSVGNPTFACVFLDASEEQVTGIQVDQCNTNGIHIHNVVASNFANLSSTRSKQHGIFVEELNTSSGANWLALNSSSGTANTWDDIHFGNGVIGYGISQNSVVTNVTVGPEPQIGTPQDRYGLYIEDNINNNLQIVDVTYTGTPTTAKFKGPATDPGTLLVRSNDLLHLTSNTTIAQSGTHIRFQGWGAGGFGGSGVACAGSGVSCGGGAGGGGGGRFFTDWMKWSSLGVTSCAAVVGQPLATGAALSGGLTTVTCGSFVFSAYAGGGGQNGAAAANTGGGGGGNPCGAGTTGSAGTGGGPGGATCGGSNGGSGAVGVGEIAGQGSGGAGGPNAAAGTTGGNEVVGGPSGGGSGGGCNAGAATAGGAGGKTILGQVAGGATAGGLGNAGLSAPGSSGMGGSGGGSGITVTNGGTGGNGALPGGGGGGGGDTCNAGSGTIGTGGTSGGGLVIVQQ